MSAAVETAVFAGNKPAWHGLGTVIEKDVMESHEALELSGLDWQVALEPVYQQRRSGEFYVVDGKKNVVRSTDERVLGTVGERFNPLQNVDAFAWGDSIVSSGQAEWYTAGSLFDGEKVWMMMKMPQAMFIGGQADERIERYICISNGHDGNTALRAFVCAERVVCANTLSIATAQGRANDRIITIRHTASMQHRMGEAQRVLGLATEYYDRLQTIGNALIEQPMSLSQFDTFLDTLLPVPEDAGRGRTLRTNQHDEIKDILVRAPNLANVNNTRWGALNAVIEWNDHRGRPRQQKHNPSEVRMEKLLLGGGNVQRAADILLAV
jgi:phage/plasmid-like protein (TIGR03299 family)